MRRSCGEPFGHVAVEFGNCRIDAVAGMNEAGIGTEPARDVVDRLITLHGLREPAAAVFARGMFRKLALVVGLKRDAFAIHLLEVARDFRRSDAGIEIVEVPFRQLAGPARGLGLGC